MGRGRRGLMETEKGREWNREVERYKKRKGEIGEREGMRGPNY